MTDTVTVVEEKIVTIEISKQHSHSNKALLDGYTHTDTEISDVISQTETNTEDIAELSLGDSQKVKISANDTTEGYLEEKLITEGDISSDVVDEGGVEKLRLSSSVLASLGPTGLNGGIDGNDGLVSINSGDATKFDMTACIRFINGVKYTIADQTAIDPSFGAGENGSFIGLDSSGFTFKSSEWTEEELKTIVPVSRLNAVSGQTGPGSTISLKRDDRFFIDRQGWHLRYYIARIFGALYDSGGVITKSSTALQLDQSAGVLFDRQGKPQILSQQGNIAAAKAFKASGVPTLLAVDPLIVDVNSYDNGSDLTAIPNNKWVCHTLLKSPKGSPQEGQFFFVYANEVFGNRTEARECGVHWSFFISQHASGLIPVASIIVQQGAPSILDDDIIDRRPFAVGGTAGSTAASIPTEQQVYEASAIPQTILNSIQGGKEIRDAATPIGGDLLSFKDNTGTTTFFKVTANGIEVLGIVSSGNATINGNIISTDAITTDKSAKKVRLGEDSSIATTDCTVINSAASHGTILSMTHVGTPRAKISTLGSLHLFIGAATQGAFFYSHVTATRYLKISHDANSNVIYNHILNAHIWQSNSAENMRLKADGTLNLSNLSTYADDAAAGTGGLVVNDVYKTATGELRIKL